MNNDDYELRAEALAILKAKGADIEKDRDTPCICDYGADMPDYACPIHSDIEVLGDK